MSSQTIAIIGAMSQEIELLRQQLQDVQTHQFGTSFTLCTGKISNKNIVLSLSGIGKVNAAIATTLVLQHFSPDVLINTGSAGGIGKDVRVGDVVIGVEAAHHDVDVTAFGYQHGQVPQQPARFDAHQALISAATSAASAFAEAKVWQGLVVSGDAFIHSDNQVNAILQHFPDALAVEMEAAAIAQTCVLLQKPFVIVRAISDSAQEKAEISFEEFLVKASEHSAKMVLQLIEAL